jgi:Tol biopolymer transport system component
MRPRAASAVAGLVLAMLFSIPASATTVVNGRIAYSNFFVFPNGDRDVGAQIFTVNPNGTGERQLTHVAGGHDAADPKWSPDGTKIAYQSNPTGEYDLWLMNGDGTGQHRILADPGWDDELPNWSPDGQWIVFSRCNSFFFCDIALVRANGTGLRRLVGGRRTNAAPSFSPDGQWVLFDSDRAGLRSALWKVRTNGTGLTRLTAPDLEAFWGSWSPDGSKITFTRDCCRPTSEVLVMNADGSNVHRVTFSGAGHQSGFSGWSPDGTRLVWMSDRAYPDSCCNDLYTSRVDGTDVRRVTNDGFPAAIADWGRKP